MADNVSQAHILVGCGGTGLKTLRRVNDLLSQDYYWRRRMDNDVYYVVIDTDVQEMKDFDNSVQNDLLGVKDNLHVMHVPLSQGETHLEPLVRQYFMEPFEGGKNAKGQARLLEHWWNRGPKGPFTAPKVTNLSLGAGQCPPISYFLTWKSLDDITTKFDDLIRQIQRRQGGMPQLLNFIVVSGMAGGTGRGSWELVSFKLRELLARYRKFASPRAFLLDASVYRDVFKRFPDQEVPMKVNSITGFSQLACWISNKKEGHDTGTAVYNYRLPSMTSPENEKSDVLVSENRLDVNTAAPVNTAYLVFEGNRRTSLADHMQYCEMVGAAIYAAMSKSSIHRREINSAFPYVGLAAATYEVNAVDLRQFFQNQAYVQAVKMLTTVHATDIDAAVAKFFERTKMLIDVTSDDVTNYREDPDGTIVQRIVHKLLGQVQNRFSALAKALEDDDVDETKRMVKALAAPNQELVQSAVREVRAQMKLDPIAVARELAQELFDKHKSVSDVKRFLDRVHEGLQQEIEEMPAEIIVRKEDDPKILVDVYAKRPFPLITRHFNQGEQNKLRELCRRAWARVNYPLVRQELIEEYETLAGAVASLAANSTDVIKTLQRLENRFIKDVMGKDANLDETFNRLFTDYENPEEALDDRFSARKFYRRELRPPMERGKELELLENEVEIGQQLYTLLRDALMQKRDFDEDKAYDLRKQLNTKVEQAIRETVGLRDDFIARQFSIRRVLEKLSRAWRRRLQKQMDTDMRWHIEEHFEEFFGFVPERRNDVGSGDVEYEFPDIEEFILRMAASLAKTCKPYWMLRGASGAEPFAVSLFVPTLLGKEEAETRVQNYVRDSTITIDVEREQQNYTGDSGSNANPFILLAYSTQGAHKLEQIESLDYGHESGVSEMLQWCEDDTGRSIFEHTTGNGIGFVDPLYVRDPKIRELRWRPWADPSADRAREKESLDALLYALFPGDASSPGLKAVSDKLAEIGWTMPLISGKDKGRFVFTRLPLQWKNGKPKVDQQLQDLDGWDQGKPVAPNAGIANVFRAVHSGEEGNDAWRKRILDESSSFWNQVLPKINVAKGTSVFGELMEEYTTWLGNKNRKVEKDDPNKEVWEKLLARVQELLSVQAD